MAEGQAAPEGMTIQALLASCGSDVVGFRDAALISLAYDAGLRLSELVGAEWPTWKRWPTAAAGSTLPVPTLTS